MNVYGTLTMPNTVTDNGIFWLSSYPKSGNTWFRVFLANILNTSNKPIDLNALHTGMIASARQWMDQALGFDSSLLSHDELDVLRPEVYTWQAKKNLNGVNYHKIHDAYTYLHDATPLIPLEGCLGAIYFIRNPLDVAISLANHASCSIDKAIHDMGDKTFVFCENNKRQFNQLRQKLLSWSLHVKSWTEAKNMNVLVQRYEDMHSHPEASFTKAVQFLQLDKTPQAIKKAISESQIDKLQQHEIQHGFSEKPGKAALFFRKGIVGDWENTLTDAQIKQIIQDHGEMMHAFGYLDTNGNPKTGQ